MTKALLISTLLSLTITSQALAQAAAIPIKIGAYEVFDADQETTGRVYNPEARIIGLGVEYQMDYGIFNLTGETITGVNVGVLDGTFLDDDWYTLTWEDFSDNPVAPQTLDDFVQPIQFMDFEGLNAIRRFHFSFTNPGPPQAFPTGDFDVAGGGTVGFDGVFFGTQVRLPGDMDGDDDVDFDDFIAFSTNFGADGAGFVSGDFNLDGSIDFVDFVLLSQNFTG